MGTDALLLFIFDWTFLNPLIESDDGRTVGEIDEVSNQLPQQTVAEAQVMPEVYY